MNSSPDGDAKANTLGIREYYSVNSWDRDLPGAALGGNIGYLRQTIPQFHQQGTRFMSAEASDNAGPNGLGCYLAAQMLWSFKNSDCNRHLMTAPPCLARDAGELLQPEEVVLRDVR
jgi:hypothetical protein